MARYIGPSCRLCRRENVKLFLKGDRCLSDKCAVDKRKTAPGQHGAQRSKLSDFGVQLREKQKLRRIYGVLERQFRSFFDRASHTAGKTGEALIQNLEMRLDSVIYRMGFSPSRTSARQLVRHNHVLINGKRCNIPSAVLRIGDKVSLVTSSTSIPSVALAIETSKRDGHAAPAWLKVDHSAFSAEVVAKPQREEVQIPVREQLVVELYSK